MFPLKPMKPPAWLGNIGAGVKQTRPAAYGGSYQPGIKPSPAPLSTPPAWMNGAISGGAATEKPVQRQRHYSEGSGTPAWMKPVNFNPIETVVQTLQNVMPMKPKSEGGGRRGRREVRREDIR